MMTVTFPTGVRVRYNDANFLRHGDATWALFTADPDKGGKPIAFIQASAGALVELYQPCKVTAPPVPSAEAAIDELLRKAEAGDLKRAASWKLKDLKRVLGKFNSRSGCWT